MVQFRPQPPGDTLDFLYRGPHCPPLSSAVLTEYNGHGLSLLHPHWPLTEPCLQSPQYDITCCNPFSTWFFPSFLGFLFVLLTRSPVAQAGLQHCVAKAGPALRYLASPSKCWGDRCVRALEGMLGCDTVQNVLISEARRGSTTDC